MQNKQKNGALSGIRILSFAQMAQGPSAVQCLTDMGADVIKIERPRTGGIERSWSGLNLFVGKESVFFLGLNRNQKSLTLDLKSAGGREIVEKIVASVDVVIENLRPGVLDRLAWGTTISQRSTRELFTHPPQDMEPTDPIAIGPVKISLPSF